MSSINARKEAALIAARSSPWIHQLIVLSYLRGHESAQGRAVCELRLILKPWRQLRHSQEIFGFPNPFGKRWGRIPALQWGSWQVNVLHTAAIGSLRCNTNKFSISSSAPGGRGMGADAVTARSLLLDQVQPSASLPRRAGTRVPAPRPGDINAGS